MSLELARIPAVESASARLSRVPAPVAAPHSERVSVSDGGRSASHDLPAAPQGTVRWYRAAFPAPRRTGLAPELVTDSDAPGTALAALPAPAARTAPGALAAYRAAMALGSELASRAAVA